MLPLVFLLITGTNALYENCDFYQELQPDQPYYIYSPDYPNPYPSGTSCRWYAVSPPGTQVFLSCENIDLPQVNLKQIPKTTWNFLVLKRNPCGMDRVAVSRTGDFRLTDASLHCGRGGFAAVSANNRMIIALQSHPESQPGSLLCNIGVQKIPEPIPDPGICECGWRNMVIKIYRFFLKCCIFFVGSDCWWIKYGGEWVSNDGRIGGQR